LILKVPNFAQNGYFASRFANKKSPISP
jgi:hypothetical protein